MSAYFWFRRDLRLHDNAALFHALKNNDEVQCVFIFDRNILDKLNVEKDARVSFIYDCILDIKSELNARGSDLKVYYGNPEEIWPRIFKNEKLSSLYFNRDYEQYARDRDARIKDHAKEYEIKVHDFKDHVIFEGTEVLKKDGLPYTVFTPYKRRWLERLKSRIEDGQYYYFKAYPSEDLLEVNLKSQEPEDIISLEQMGFKRTDIEIPEKEVRQKLIKDYKAHRNFPSERGTSRLGIHFRFGTISIRQKAAKAIKLSETFLSELIWRDFYSQILYHFPHVEHRSFREKYDYIEWRNNEEEFEAWSQGKTGYPIVDAGMRELNNTGFMHNRVRMITASFLTKHLLINWRWGEAYFAEKLLDFDLASNNGGWQWAAGSGTDAAPYFRIFNPYSQQEKFDKNFDYIKKWVPEYGTQEYPDPIVDHKQARNRCLETYKAALQSD
jgi:deoxyribodipyrimidine photo-lyase